MKQRNLFNRPMEIYSEKREKIKLYAEKHPERIIGAMFLILLIAVTAFLIMKATHKESRTSSLNEIFNRVSAPSARPPEKPMKAGILDLLSLYGKSKSINPDSLTLKDSLLIKEIDKDLNKILDEKD